MAAEVVSQVTARGFHLLDAPPLRLSSQDTPIPAHPDLWKAHRPSAATIADAARYLISL